MATDNCFTGIGSMLTSQNATMKFGDQAATTYGIRRISGFGRSVIVIDDSDLSLTAGDSMQYCPGDLVALRPLTIDAKQDVDNVTRFPTGATNHMENPVPLGVASGTATNQVFVLEFPTTASTNGLRINFSGFFNDDAGIELVITDRHRQVFQIQPDGRHVSYTQAT